YQVHAPSLNSEDYLKRNDPVAAALTVLMDYPEEERALIKKRIFDIIMESDLEDGDKAFLGAFVCVYLPQETITVDVTEEIMEQIIEYEKTWYDLAIEKAEISTLHRTIINLLGKKFGEITNELMERIKNIQDITILDNLAEQVLFIDSLDKFTVPEMS
ncbi:MAG: hypothetical protein AAF639_42325, partial [Chloroflexota bacterium]